MRLVSVSFLSRLVMVAVLGSMLSGAVDGQVTITGTEEIARRNDISLEIVGDNHPELPNLEDGYKSHGGFNVNFKQGGINFARLDRGSELIQQIFVFYRNWNDEQPLDARAVGCRAERYHLEDPVACFRAILGKMEGGRGPVRLEVRLYYGEGERVATIPINTVQIPWMYIQQYAKMEATK